MDTVATSVDALGRHPGRARRLAALVPGGPLGGEARPRAWDLPLHVVRTWALSSAPRPSTWSRRLRAAADDFEAAVLDRLSADVAALHLPAACVVTCQVLHGAPRSPAGGVLARRARCWSSGPAASAASSVW